MSPTSVWFLVSYADVLWALHDKPKENLHRKASLSPTSVWFLVSYADVLWALHDKLKENLCRRLACLQPVCGS